MILTPPVGISSEDLLLAATPDNPNAKYDRDFINSITDGEAPSKNWAKAIRLLLKAIERNLSVFSTPADPE